MKSGKVRFITKVLLDRLLGWQYKVWDLLILSVSSLFLCASTLSLLSSLCDAHVSSQISTTPTRQDKLAPCSYICSSNGAFFFLLSRDRAFQWFAAEYKWHNLFLELKPGVNKQVNKVIHFCALIPFLKQRQAGLCILTHDACMFFIYWRRKNVSETPSFLICSF